MTQPERDGLPISDEALGAAWIALEDGSNEDGLRDTSDDALRDAIQAFLAAEGFEIEHHSTIIEKDGPKTSRLLSEPKPLARLASPWRPA